ncbi:MAG: DUF448 domain-containing protein [Deltaproteobacteria bacterium]|nr:DUF448 domain-containing protein [Deltaproteobacteria bacterium]
MNRGHIPIRTCVGCRSRRPAIEMIRMQAQDKTLILADKKTNFSGRACYICPLAKCAEKALKKGRLEKALRTEIEIIPSVESIFKKA